MNELIEMRVLHSLPFYILSCTVGLTSALALPKPPSSTSSASSASSSSSSSSSSEQIINLQAQHEILSPSERMRKIASRCESMGISTFDVYGDYQKDPSTSFLRKFEKEVSDTFGKEDAVFMPSGVMAQSIALLIHSSQNLHLRQRLDKDQEEEEGGGGRTKNGKKKKIRFACHETSHLLLWEENSYKELLDMDVVEILSNESDNDYLHVPPMSYQDVKHCFMKQKETAEDENLAKTLGEDGLTTLILELPHRELGGKRTPWVDVIDMSNLCKENGIKFHCDGARIFEASAGYELSLSEMADVFDSIYISFYKGLGAISGAMLIGDKSFCDEARVWLRRFGGNLYTLLPYAVDSWDGFEQNVSNGNIVTFKKRLEKLQYLVKEIQSVSSYNNGDDDDEEVVVVFDPSIPETNMVHVYLKASKEECEEARNAVMDQHDVEIFSRLGEIESTNPLSELGYEARFEWTIGNANGSIENEVFITSWKAFINELKDLKHNFRS